MRFTEETDDVKIEIDIDRKVLTIPDKKWIISVRCKHKDYDLHSTTIEIIPETIKSIRDFLNTKSL